jgi:uncharacterized phage-associated protein
MPAFLPSPLRLCAQLLRERERAGLSMCADEAHRLLFFAHGWHLALMGEPLIEEPFEAMPRGPVLMSLRRRFRAEGFGEADALALSHPLFAKEPPFPAGSASLLVIATVARVHSSHTAAELSLMSRLPGAPWDEAWRREGNDSRIDNASVRRWFSNLARSAPKASSEPFPQAFSAAPLVDVSAPALSARRAPASRPRVRRVDILAAAFPAEPARGVLEMAVATIERLA